MVRQQIARRGIRDPRLLEAMERVPRHEFVPPEFLDLAYDDRPLPIGFDQTISQPYIVAYMIDAADVRSGDRVLEIGAGSGYETALLTELADDVFAIEYVPALAARAARTLRELGYRARIIGGDGRRGWPRAAPFDVVLVAAAAREIPDPLIEQLASDGRLVAPIGTAHDQTIVRVTRTTTGPVGERLIDVRFVPLLGEDV